MRKFALWGGMAFAILILVLSITNASWLAPDPKGAPKQIANRAIGPEYVKFEPTSDEKHVLSAAGLCDAAPVIYEPTNTHLPNSRTSILRADRMGAWHVEVDAQMTADGEIVLFYSTSLDCIAEEGGLLSNRTLAELQELDTGYGYTVVGGGDEMHPYRGKGHRIETLTEVADALPSHGKLMVHLLNDQPAYVDAVLAALVGAGRDPSTSGDAFFGRPTALRRVRELYPEAWAFNPDEARQCTADYVVQGWTGIVPASCEGGTMLIALDDQALLWGWPNRLIARLEGVGAKIVIEGPGEPAPGEVVGITLPEQLTEIPSSFNGYVWTDDAFNTLPALIPRFDNRTQEEIDASQAALERRRNAQ
ncbi:glycerophosphodiester phosphodiesterase family protein [Erythrobacter sp. THAF29]|uniref:glycerophosphodiester phosphodiesterase family protein n=1 Tax=Erythrobacter sp. THAF29 TaxID=2587851 RepID=UPI0012693911|nr:glycerophosphodiester phosphodiesterase family protein [Erythrobacter sp. THAF29]QFT76271.1 Glycerophosphoryl diester phosphodiesterase family protein [Erythrobacter sp. THAF29]